MLSFQGAFGTDVRPARKPDGRKAWAQDATPGNNDGTRIDATFVNDLKGLLVSLCDAYSISMTEGDDDLLVDVIAAALDGLDTDDIDGLEAALALKADLASPALTGTPTAPTATLGDNSTKIATSAFVQAAIAALINSAPGALDTLDELAAALGDDNNFAATMTTALATKLSKASNLSDLTDVSAARGNLGLGSIATLASSAKQDAHANLTAFAGLTLAANKLPYGNGSGTLATTDFNADARTLVGLANFAAMRGASGLNLESRTTHGDSDYTILSTDRIVATSATLTSARAWTLPAASALNAGAEIIVDDAANGVTATNKITVTRAGSDTINGANTFDLKVPRGRVVLISDGSAAWTAQLLTPGTAETQSGGDNSTKIATTEFVTTALTGGGAITGVVDIRTASATITIPAGATKLRVLLVGGGGGGGTAQFTCAAGTGGGGGSGSWLTKYLTSLTPGNNLVLTLGAGGTSANNGSDSTLASGSQSITTLTGKGGTRGNNGSDSVGTNGDGGAVATNGDLNCRGDQNGVPGHGGFTPDGSGGRMLGGNNTGEAGTHGGGGGGGSRTTVGSASGGAGGNGYAIFVWYA